MTRYFIAALAVLAGCTAQQQTQFQAAVTIACQVESQAAPIAIAVDPRSQQQADIAKADAAAKAACQALKGVVLPPPS